MVLVTAFDAYERRTWAGRAEAFAGSFAQLCAYTVPQLLDAAGVRAGVRVLDVGTGTGTAAVAACRRGAKVTAVDAEPSMVELAARAAPAADVRVAVLPQLPFDDGRFDAVVGNFVLNHVGRPRDALAELRRVLAHRKVPELLHDRDLRARDTSRRAQRVFGRAGEVILAGQEIERADGRIDFLDAPAQIAIDPVEIQIAFKYPGPALHVVPERLPARGFRPLRRNQS